MLSRRFPVKTMFVGFVARPIPHRSFDCRIYLERISQTKYIQTYSTYTKFFREGILNAQIKNAAWRDLVNDLDYTTEDIKFRFRETYCLDEDVMERLDLLTSKK